MLNFCDFIHVFVFITTHQLNENDILAHFNFCVHVVLLLLVVKNI